MKRMKRKNNRNQSLWISFYLQLPFYTYISIEVMGVKAKRNKIGQRTRFKRF